MSPDNPAHENDYNERHGNALDCDDKICCVCHENLPDDVMMRERITKSARTMMQNVCADCWRVLRARRDALNKVA